jgi:hypothetical protein
MSSKKVKIRWFCHAELVSASHETLKRVQGDNKTGIVTASCAIIVGLGYNFSILKT